VFAVAGLAGGMRANEKMERPLDNDFLVKAATANNAEIEVGKLAERRASSNEVKDYANMLVKDHKTANDKLGGLIKTRKVGVVAGFEKETRDEINRLSNLNGKDFDRAFLDHMIQDHKKAISIFENQAKNGKEEDIRAYAKEMLPDLQKHLKKAEELAKSTSK